jgi:hypothetical protein
MHEILGALYEVILQYNYRIPTMEKNINFIF